MPASIGHHVIGVIILLVLQPFINAQTSDGSREIEILAIGATMAEMTPVVIWLADEPMTSVTHVPNRGFGFALPAEEYQRLVRIYFPRTYPILLGYDVVLFVGGCSQYLSPLQVSWLKQAVSDGGRSALGDLGGVSTTEEIVTSWISSGMWEIFPNDAPAVVTRGEWSQGPFWVGVSAERENNPLEPFVDLGIEKVAGDQGRLILPREGCTIYGNMLGISFQGYEDPPFLVAWDYDSGRTMLVAEFLNHPWFHTPSQGGENEYAPDVLVNMLLNVIDRPVFREILMIHELRTRIEEFRQRYTLVLNTLDFVERFGANTNAIRLDLAEALRLEDTASQQYLELDVEGSIACLDLSIEMVRPLVADALDLKDRALIWIYVIEWFVVMATMMASGTLLYMMMVKRSLYRSTRHTRLGQTG